MDRFKMFRAEVSSVAFIGVVAVAAQAVVRGVADTVPDQWWALLLLLAGGFVLRRPNGGNGAA